MTLGWRTAAADGGLSLGYWGAQRSYSIHYRQFAVHNKSYWLSFAQWERLLSTHITSCSDYHIIFFSPFFSLFFLSPIA